MTSTNSNPLDFINNNSGIQSGSQADLVQMLLYEIIRVKELITYYDSIPNGGGQLGSSILNELVSEAYNSLVNYDTVLMQKYYDLLLNCDWFSPKDRKERKNCYLFNNSNLYKPYNFFQSFTYPKKPYTDPNPYGY